MAQKKPYERIKEMERLLQEDLGFRKFIPYIQLQEYEALLYADTAVMQQWLGLYNYISKDCFTKIRNSKPADGNPELINESPETAPSKEYSQFAIRMIKLMTAY